VSELGPSEIVRDENIGDTLFTVGKEKHPHTKEIITVARACRNGVNLDISLDHTGYCTATLYKKVPNQKFRADEIDSIIFKGDKDDSWEATYALASRLKYGADPEKLFAEFHEANRISIQELIKTLKQKGKI